MLHGHIQCMWVAKTDQCLVYSILPWGSLSTEPKALMIKSAFRRVIWSWSSTHSPVAVCSVRQNSMPCTRPPFSRTSLGDRKGRNSHFSSFASSIYTDRTENRTVGSSTGLYLKRAALMKSMTHSCFCTSPQYMQCGQVVIVISIICYHLMIFFILL